MPSFYDTTIAPSTTRFFSDVQADPRLDSRTKAELQGTFLAGMQGIEAQRAKLAEERQQSAMRQLQYESGTLNLENAKMERKRLEDSMAKGSALDADLNAVLDSADDYETKRANLARVQMKYADMVTNPAFEFKLRAASNALVEPRTVRDPLTPAQLFQMGEAGADPRALAAGDYYGAGMAAGRARAQREQAQADAEAAKQQDKEMYDLLHAKIDFEKPDDTVPGASTAQWLKPESHQAAKLLIQYGSPDEKKKFEAAGIANDDVTRANIARDIQIRMLQKRLNGAVKDPLKRTADEEGARLVNSAPPLLQRPK